MSARAISVLPGTAQGPVLAASQGLSFWGGVDPQTSRIIDAHHPLHGESVAGRVLMMPTSRGSCSGSGVLLNLALTGRAPAALIFEHEEDVLTLGALIAGMLFDRPLPVLRLGGELFAEIAQAGQVTVTESELQTGNRRLPLAPLDRPTLKLSEPDKALLAGQLGPAAGIAMAILVEMAGLQGADEMLDVTRAHIDGCIYSSPANLHFVEKMLALGGRVCVPTTMNAISVDHRGWRSQGVPDSFGLPASRLADAYVALGAEPSFTCAPYLLANAPNHGEALGWSESNAVIYANSVLGARTVKHPDFLDLCIALTGRAPKAGVYLDSARAPARLIRTAAPAGIDDAFWPMLGWLAGQAAPDCVPLITGLEDVPASEDDLKALCAAFGATSAAPMLHLAGHTPEAAMRPSGDADAITLAPDDFRALWSTFNAAPAEIDLVAIGSPHASIGECRALARLIEGKRATTTRMIVTLGRDTLDQARREGLIARFEAFGVETIPDLCWCSITEPVFPPSARVVMTNSGKYAHYGPGLSGRAMRFGSLVDCVAAALTGRAPAAPPQWLA